MANDYFSQAKMEMIAKTAQEQMQKLMNSFTDEMQKAIEDNCKFLYGQMNSNFQIPNKVKVEVFDISYGDTVEFFDENDVFVSEVKILQCYYKNFSPIDETHDADSNYLKNKKNEANFKIALFAITGDGERYFAVSGKQLRKYQTN